VFELGEDDKAEVKTNPVPRETEGSCRDAADQCPESAIEIEEE
jgi:ferredoxin